MKIKFCLSLSCIPARFENLHLTINSLQQQTLKPDKIFLNIPYKFRRFPHVDVNIDKLKNINFDNLEIIRCDDFGPGTSLIGPLDKLKNYDCVILVNDDHAYNEKMCEILIEKFKENMEAAYSFFIYHIWGMPIAQTADGFLVNTKLLTGVREFYNKHVSTSNTLFLNDDFWLSIYLNKLRNTKILSLEYLIKDRTGERLIYKQHIKQNALTDSYNPFLSRRTYAKFDYIKILFKEYFFLKKPKI